MTGMRERIARAMLAKDYPDDVGGEMEYLWWDRHGETYLAYADAAMSVYAEVTREHHFPDDVRDLAVKVMVENTFPFMSDYLCAAIIAERHRGTPQTS